jgi:hypothetical protein
MKKCDAKFVREQPFAAYAHTAVADEAKLVAPTVGVSGFFNSEATRKIVRIRKIDVCPSHDAQIALK